MGSMIEINDTLRISKEQGFPEELDIEKHLREKPYTLDDVKDRIFSFTAKPKIRVYKQPPVRNFLVQELNGKWIYWGLCYVLEVHHDYVKQETSGKFRIVRMHTPEEVKQAFLIADFDRPELDYFDR